MWEFTSKLCVFSSQLRVVFGVLICLVVIMWIQMYALLIMCSTDSIVLAYSLVVADPKFVRTDKFIIYLYDKYAHTRFIIS